MRTALHSARKSLNAGDFPVGCVIADKYGVVCTGRRINSEKNGNELDHAEIIALRKLHTFQAQSVSSDFSIYLNSYQIFYFVTDFI
jgi:tRNA(Arg) A34 adenosine deaminase TadA